MTFKEFDKYQENLLAEVFKMRDTKGKEYAHSESRFANFDRLAEREDISRLKVAHIFFTKHLDAIESFIKYGRTFSTESIQGRIVDAICYLTLIGGMIKEDEGLVVEPAEACKLTPGRQSIVANNLDQVRCNKCGREFEPGQTIWYQRAIHSNEKIFHHLKCPDPLTANATFAAGIDTIKQQDGLSK